MQIYKSTRRRVKCFFGDKQINILTISQRNIALTFDFSTRCLCRDLITTIDKIFKRLVLKRTKGGPG